MRTGRQDGTTGTPGGKGCPLPLPTHGSGRGPQGPARNSLPAKKNRSGNAPEAVTRPLRRGLTQPKSGTANQNACGGISLGCAENQIEAVPRRTWGEAKPLIRLHADVDAGDREAALR